MTDRERLTTDRRKIFARESLTIMSMNKDELRRHYNEIFDSLQEYEVAEEQGQLIRPPCMVGDYVEWDNGIGANKRLHQIKGFYYEPENGLRYDLGVVCPVITHQAITRIVPREEAEKALRGGDEK